MLNIFSCAHWPFVSQGNLSLSLPSPVGPLANPENFLPCSKCLLRGSYQKLACFLLCGCLWTPACASPVATTAQGGEARDHGRTMKDILPSSWAPHPAPGQGSWPSSHHALCLPYCQLPPCLTCPHQLETQHYRITVTFWGMVMVLWLCFALPFIEV